MNVQVQTKRQSSGEQTARSYESISSIYERLNSLFTGGQNVAARLSQIEDMHAGQRVLYVGVGPGEEALEAARRGIRVTCVDLSPSMIEIVRKRFETADLPGEFVCADIMEFESEEPFDVVVSNFFLNIFSRPVMLQMLTRLVSLVRPGGDFVLADFAPPRGNIVLRVRHRLYYTVANVSHWTLGLCALHKIYNYAEYYPALGLRLQSTRYFRLSILGPGPWIFQSMRATKEDKTHDALAAS
ncbi:MAG TPA: class I SAM-dependent methyltransferase [Planctomycetaceae bacterium]|nr:class I SAM-dependent methyltransferase [Planctomycetaceae bacterium]